MTQSVFRMVCCSALVLIAAQAARSEELRGALQPLSVVVESGLYPYQWTISASQTDPFNNVAPFVSGLTTLYLWLACEDGGASSAALYVITPPGGLFITAIGTNGWTAQGGGGSIFLTHSGCATPEVAANLLVVQSTPGAWCISPQYTMDCQDPPVAHEMAWTGLSHVPELLCYSGICGPLSPHCPWIFCYPDTCFEDAIICINSCQNCWPEYESCDECNPISIERMTWGRMKGIYRK